MMPDVSVAPGARPTLDDVARLAGVSPKTASRVFNDEPHVTERTATKVRAAAGELGFRPNTIARELKRGARSNTVGLIISDVANPFYARVTRGVERRLRRAGLQLISASSDEDPDQERELVGQLLERRVGGLLITTCRGDHTYLDADRRLGLPVAFLDRAPDDVVADTVALDNTGGAALAARHLLAHGHRRIGLVGDLGRLSTHRERVAGFSAAMIEAEVQGWQRYVRADSHDAESAGRAVRELLALPDPPSALFTTNNRITVGALRVLRESEQNPALVGFDDFELADLLGVTVIAHSPEQMGELGAERIIARLDNPARVDVHTDRLPVRLVQRGSGERPPG